MMKKTKIAKIVFSVFLTVISVTAIILSSIAIANQNNSKIMDAYEIGLRQFFSEEITDMHAENSSSPVERGYFNDNDLLDEFKSTLLSAAYQKTSPYDSSQAVIYLEFNTESGNYYSFGVLGYKFSVNINGDKKYYSTNAVTILRQTIHYAIELATQQ